ncbi:MAG TPA: glycosyltransferase family 39 protein [Anaerolineales bacterium]|nr:glycosyltransferase family 39 protein [Anaerolineales bacterium]
MNATALFALLLIFLITIGLEVLLFRFWQARKNPPQRPKAPLSNNPITTFDVTRRKNSLPRRAEVRVVPLNPVVRPTPVERTLPGILPRAWPTWQIPPRVRGAIARVSSTLSVRWHPRAEVLLLSAALVLYLATRFIGLDRYPVYFNGDEAIHTVYANQLIVDKGMAEANTFLPTYFKNGPKYNLSLSVYVQVLPTLLFGKSILATRATSILLTLIPATVVALMMRDFLKLPYGWSASLLLAVVPVWFLHSRTAFETVLSVSMYAGFLYYYLRYRLDQPQYLYPALIFGALTFYAYSPAQLIIVACGFFLLIFDLRYHMKHWQTAVGGLALLVILALPYIRFRLQVTDAITEHLRELGSYWLEPISFEEKMAKFFAIYWNGLSPAYWYTPNFQDLPRHQMGPYSQILRITLPFAVLGLGLAFRAILPSFHGSPWLKGALQFNRWTVPWQVRARTLAKGWNNKGSEETRIAYRTILLALFIAPLPATLAQIGVTRILTFVLPITLLTAVGLIACLQWLEARVTSWLPELRPLFQPILGLTLFLGLSWGLGTFTADAVRNGPLWYQDYGFGGMQFGAPGVFEKIKKYLASYNAVQIILTPDWANNADFLTLFFLDNAYDIEMFSGDSLLLADRTLMPNHIVILTPEEYERIHTSNKFKSVDVIDTLDYPNGKPGFYFLHLVYADNLDEILEQEREARRVLVDDSFQLDGQTVQIRHSVLDMGEIAQLFDGDNETFVRTAESNPAVFELTFTEPRPIQEIALVVGADKTQLTFTITTVSGEPPIEITQTVDGRDLPREKVINFGQTYTVQTLRIEALLVENGEPAHVHLWDIWLR